MAADRPQQIPIDLAPAPSFAADDFVPTPSNQIALAFMDKWPDWPQVGAILVGPAGAGKSHLASIIAERAATAIQQLASIAAIDKDADLIILDCGEGGAFDEETLFHLINHLRLSDRPTGRLLLLTCEEPKQWALRLPDLLSRLNALDLVRIDPPDDFSLMVVLHKLFADRQVSVDDSVIDYLIRRMPRSYQAAHHIVHLMDHAGLAQKKRLTRAIAAQALTDGGFQAE